MYYFLVASLMCVLPALSIAIEAAHSGAALGVSLIIKWYVFWAIGLRLLLAGIRQVVQPAYTARQILGLKSDDALFLVRELGFANVAIGAVATASVVMPTLRFAGAVTGTIFYGLAGCSHAFQGHRNRLENVAMVSDLFAAALLLGLLLASTLYH
jgi:hypothetical protein